MKTVDYGQAYTRWCKDVEAELPSGCDYDADAGLAMYQEGVDPSSAAIEMAYDQQEDE